MVMARRSENMFGLWQRTTNNKIHEKDCKRDTLSIGMWSCIWEKKKIYIKQKENTGWTGKDRGSRLDKDWVIICCRLVAVNHANENRWRVKSFRIMWVVLNVCLRKFVNYWSVCILNANMTEGSKRSLCGFMDTHDFSKFFSFVFCVWLCTIISRQTVHHL